MSPRVEYVIAGQTHPKVLAHEGERYRESLQRLIDDLGVSDTVTLDDRYLDARQLALLARPAGTHGNRDEPPDDDQQEHEFHGPRVRSGGKGHRDARAGRPSTPDDVRPAPTIGRWAAGPSPRAASMPSACEKTPANRPVPASVVLRNCRAKER